MTQAEARTRLLEMLSTGQTLYMLTEQVSRSGMSRRIRVFIAQHDTATVRYRDEVRDISYHVRALFGQRHDADSPSGYQSRGCGMDMHFALCDDLSRILGIPLHYRSFDSAC